ncbi:MAG: glycosyltransferase [Micrococcales bacterium]|nr:glycosyltransferase [Micrococcales bacterium]
MLVATSVATDARVLREASTLADAGHGVHVIGKSVPTGWEPPAGLTVSSVGTSSVFRAEGGASLAGRRLSPHLRFARWVLLPQHRASAFGRWAAGALADGRHREFDVVHAHDFTALAAGAELARLRGVPLVYDTHEFWQGRPREHRPTPLADLRERRLEDRLAREATAVITVGDGIADALRRRYGWGHVHVVRNTFPARRAGSAMAEALPALSAPVGLVYAGRLSAYRELETIAAASRLVDLPITVMGPADETWLGTYDPGRVRVEGPLPAEQVDRRLAEAGLALVTHSDAWENHRLALPNKLFHAVRAGVPCVATDVGELARTVRAHGIGTLYRPGDAADMGRAIEQAVADYPALREAVARAADELAWEKDAAVLLSLYQRLEPAEQQSENAVAPPEPHQAHEVREAHEAPKEGGS